MASKTLRLGVIDVLNVLPVYYGIINQLVPVSCNLQQGRVTELNKALADGEIDISVVSSFEYARHHERYYVLPDLSVGADGPVRSIYLFLDKPLEQLNRDIIKLTEFSLTSVHLIRYILKDYLVTFTQSRTEHVNGELLIADDAIRRFYQKRDAYAYDLSELWKKKTGLPFVFALWVCRRDVYQNYPHECLSIFNALIASKKLAKGLYRQMAERAYSGIFPDAASCEVYLRNIHYELSTSYQHGFLQFQQEIQKLGLLNQIAPITFMPRT